MSLYPFEVEDDYESCRPHGRWNCEECAAESARKIRQIEHEASVKRQKAKLKPLAGRGQSGD